MFEKIAEKIHTYLKYLSRNRLQDRDENVLIVDFLLLVERVQIPSFSALPGVESWPVLFYSEIGT